MAGLGLESARAARYGQPDLRGGGSEGPGKGSGFCITKSMSSIWQALDVEGASGLPLAVRRHRFERHRRDPAAALPRHRSESLFACRDV